MEGTPGSLAASGNNVRKKTRRKLQAAAAIATIIGVVVGFVALFKSSSAPLDQGVVDRDGDRPPGRDQ
jgi:hypothetical protein